MPHARAKVNDAMNQYSTVHYIHKVKSHPQESTRSAQAHPHLRLQIKWVVDVTAAVVFAGQLADRLRNSWSGIGGYTTILQA